MDFPDSNHLAKTLTIITGPDTVNLTYHNFFASKEKVTQVIRHRVYADDCVCYWHCVHPLAAHNPPSLSTLIVQQDISHYRMSLCFPQMRRPLSPL